MKRLKPGKNNKEDRISFIKYWVDYIKNNSDEKWSKQQKILIDSQIKNAKNYRLSAKKYLKIKNETIKN